LKVAEELFHEIRAFIFVIIETYYIRLMIKGAKIVPFNISPIEFSNL